MELNPAQREVVATLSGPLLVLAGAGTGKTRVVTHRIARLIEKGTPPDRILAVTFTNKAAGEMLERATRQLGFRAKKRPEISTFHSLCVRMLRRHIVKLGYPQTFAIYDRGDQEGMARSVLREIKVGTDVLRPGDLLNFIGRWKNSSVRPAQAAEMADCDKTHLAAAAYRRYQNALKAAGALDFDDLLLVTEDLFVNHEDARRREAARFDHVLIDEFQDTNDSQYRIVRALAGEHRNLCVVGDDDQSIYGWRGANVSHILQFRRDWPDAKVVRLEENYRSQTPILMCANRLIAFNTKRHKKVLRPHRTGGDPPRIIPLPDDTVEAEHVVQEITSLVSQRLAQPRDIAILFRTNEQPRPFETELRRARLPYVLVGGMSFFDRKEVRDILAFCKLLCNPRDEVALLRIINKPPRGIGQAAAKALVEGATARGSSIWEVCPELCHDGSLPATAAKAVKDFHALINRYADRARNGPLVSVLHDLVDEVDYRQEIARQYDDANERVARWAAVEEVINSLASYESRTESPTLAGFLDDVALTGRDDDRDEEQGARRNAITLLTLHSAKGLEFPRVYMVGMEEGLLPHHRAIEAEGQAIDEERRLCYVGVTRARDHLTLTCALSRMKWGKPRFTDPSRFLFELSGNAENPALKAALEQRAADAAKKSRKVVHGRSPRRYAGSENHRRTGVPAGKRGSQPSGSARRPAPGGGRTKPGNPG